MEHNAWIDRDAGAFEDQHAPACLIDRLFAPPRGAMSRRHPAIDHLVIWALFIAAVITIGGITTLLQPVLIGLIAWTAGTFLHHLMTTSSPRWSPATVARFRLAVYAACAVMVANLGWMVVVWFQQLA